MAKLGGMRLRRWGVAAAALLVAGCGSSVGGQALPMPGIATSSGSSGTTPTSIASATPSVTTVTPFPDPTSAPDPTVGSTPATTSVLPGPTSTTAPTSAAATDQSTAGTTTAPSTTVKWQLPVPTGGPTKQNKFGNVIAAPGRPFAVEWTSTKQVAVVWVVDSIQVDRGCEVQVKGKNGHLVVISVRAQLGHSTGEELSNESIGFTDSFWTAFDAKDTAEVDTGSSAADACVTSKTGFAYADTMKPDRVYSGKIALDVSSAKGTVVLLNSLDGGWVYSYG